MCADIRNTCISEINQCIPADYALICCASFESRCLSIPNMIAKSAKKVVIYRNSNLSFPVAIANQEHIKEISCEPIVCTTPFDQPDILADSMAKEVEAIASASKNLLIDTTTFTHEALLILLRIIYLFRASFDSIYCLYTGAGKYSPGSTPADTWLSKGCKDVRNVIGFPGMLKPIANTSLIILAGFELERATKLIELVEPDRLILGNGIDPINDNISDIMAHFHKKYNAWKDDYKIIEKDDFEFSCKDIEKTVKTLKTIIAKAPEDNHIIVPLNTKLSTISAAIVALENKSIQLCYAVPEVYNYENYSTPGEDITIVNLKTFDVFE